MVKLICTSCKSDISIINKSTKFPCPKCTKEKIVRCGNCRQISAKYKCKECGFDGP